MTAPPTATSSPSLTPLTGEEERLYAELKSALGPRIQVVSLLGRGGMALVFLGRDPQLKRSIAIKVLAPSFAGTENARARFTREAQAAATVTHPNVAGVYDVGELPSGMPYYLMQFVDGTNLGAVIEAEGMMAEGRARRVIGEIASALAAAHAKGLVHRDIKPANIIIESETKEAIVVDFGISAATDKDLFKGETDTGGTLTAIGTYVGTPKYTSPEQAAHDAISGKSDVYSLGVVAYEALTGHAPFSDTTPMALLAAHIKDVPAPVKSKRPELDATFASLVDRCLAKDPAKRPEAMEIARFLVPEPETAMEWPPPGLEELRGQGARFARSFVWMGVFATVFLIALALQPSRSTSGWYDFERSLTWSFITNIGGGTNIESTPDATQAWLFVLLASYTAIATAFIVFVIRTVRMMRSIEHGRRQGYPVRVLSAVGMDEADDTAALMSRSGPFAMLTVEGQRKLLRARRVRSTAIPSGFLATMVVTLVWLLTAGAGDSSPELLSLPLAIALVSPIVIGVLVTLWTHDFEARLQGRSLWAQTARMSARKEFVRDWIERAHDRAEVPQAPAGYALTAAATLAGILTLLALFVVMQASMIAARLVTTTRGAPGDMEHADGWSRAEQPLHVALDTIVRRPEPGSALATPPAVDSAATRRIVAGQYRRVRMLHVLPPEDTVGLPPPDGVGYFDPYAFGGTFAGVRRARLMEVSASPWFDTFRQFARGSSIRPPYFYPTKELMRARANGLARLTGMDVPGVGASIGRFTTILLEGPPSQRGAARVIAEDVIRAGLRMMRSPVLEEYEIGVSIAYSGVQMLREYARITNDVPLTRLTQMAATAASTSHQRRWNGRRFENLAMMWAATGDLSDAEHAKDALIDWRLHGYERWHAARSLVSSYCTNASEILFGIDPKRLEYLDLANSASFAQTRTPEWIELQRERLNGWMTDPRRQLETEDLKVEPSLAIDIVGWLGLKDVQARMTHCSARPFGDQ